MPERTADALKKAISAIGTPEQVAKWLQTPLATLRGLTPAAVIERGESDRVWRILARLGVVE
jgi:hypothetical protein